MRLSKNFYYERPYAVTGGIQLAGPEQEPKGIWKDRVTGTWKATPQFLEKEMVATK